ncbi:hypothetical protein GCM10011519_10940 [Marmoricola endophyticus]|uniref:Uncharacterized protein n=1 Tax=Marmoricola endophyticus TaxID=2040280 RepID=A0A917BEI7_9ACTN|nr:hypothetical protein [Marmoricola endophyticus]GGF39120.1 hypothetical protein GCM10011519_10940 [Marmoricola endophyticus]
MPHVPNELLGRLVGMRLFSVEFVLDYVVVRFDDAADQAALTCQAMPLVELPARGPVRDGAPGYADALRSLVGYEVVGTAEASGLGLRIGVGTGTIVINPSREELTGPEIALLGGFADAAWMCWRPGEDCFTELG